jgi:molybdate transport system ATP-binding protein
LLEIAIKKTLPDFHLNIELFADREILSVLGPSGSGKTMTLLCIAGLLRPDEGTIKLNGRTLFSSESKVSLPPQKRKIGFVFQNYALFPHLTVAENIAYGIGNLTKKKQAGKVADLLEIINIPGLKKRYPAELSSGQQQRVALARAVAPEPEALLLDEPFSALDLFRRERLEFELLNLQKYYSGDILFVTHDLAQGFKLGERIAIYDNGTIIQCEHKDTVITRPANLTAAKLTGVKNIFGGIITAIENNSVCLYAPAFRQSLKVENCSTKGLNLEQIVNIGIRPEHIGLANNSNENSVVCKLDQVVEGVTTLNYYYHAKEGDETHQRVECSAPRPFTPACHKPGTTCRLYFPPERLMIMKH